MIKRAALAAALLACVGCSSLLYVPIRPQIVDPAKLGVTPDEVFFDNETGQKLHGWYIHANPGVKEKGQVVFFHGNGENLSTHFAALLWLPENGYSYFIFDNQGYGLSVGKPSPEGTVHDGKAAIRWAAAKYPRLPLAVFGQSLGGAVALRTVVELKSEAPIRLLTVDSTFASYRGAARSVLSHHWLTWWLQPATCLVLSDQWAPDDRVAEISPIPLIVMHGTKDQVIDYELGRDVYLRAREPKELWTVDGGRHIDAFWVHADVWRPKYLEALDHYLVGR